MRKKRIVLAVQTAFFILASSAFSQAPPQAQDLIQAAHDAVSLDKIGPYELRAAIVLHGEKPKTVPGHIRVVRNGDLTRTEFQLGAYEETRIAQPGKEYLVRSRVYTPAEIHFLSTFVRSWDPLPPKPHKDFFNFSRSYEQRIHSIESVCLSEKQQFSERLLCFDSARHVVLRENFSQNEQIEFADYVPLERGLLFPKRIVILKSNQPVLEIKDIEIEKKNPGEEAFVAPAEAIELEQCDDQVPPQRLKSPDPDFTGVEKGEVAFSVIVDKDGTILRQHEEHQGKGKLKDDEFLERTQTAVGKWRFTPSTCGSHPVATEIGVGMKYVRP